MRGKYRPFAEDSKGILKNLGGEGGIEREGDGISFTMLPSLLQVFLSLLG
jgi:hypothetical protein